MHSTAAKCSIVCGWGQILFDAINNKAAIITAAPFSIVSIRISWPGQSTNEICLNNSNFSLHLYHFKLSSASLPADL